MLPVKDLLDAEGITVDAQGWFAYTDHAAPGSRVEAGEKAKVTTGEDIVPDGKPASD